ncbi:hypothetical protein QL992_04455 [Microbacterium sp. APC 3898]|uniref:Uncharacterized protein n=1 Tax=Planococcus notacanthi TaxID=3035188 RepID=A0ABT7ZLG7_9BACL|nr:MULTISPECIES: hypothetical protein [Terrabacteria group]MDN3428011.1 hypothetical protein [Planococcus sp. APC 4016]MDN3498454.1 hypothetical protein [Microbacterium sp. APC 3898]
MEYSGGYFLLSAASANQAYYLKQVVDGGFCVEKLISMDEEVGGVFPNIFDIWSGRKPKRPTPVLSKTVLDKVLVSMLFGTLEEAREGFREARTQDPSVSLIGISLDEKHLPNFHDWRDHSNDMNGEGVVLCLEKKQPASSGIFAGYDIAGYELGGRFLSFLGNDLLQDYLAFDRNLSINKYGLFPERQKAEELARYTNDVLKDLVGAEEDLMWLPWKITIYEGF